MSEYINRLADKNIMKAIFNYLMEDINSRYMGSTKSLGEWYKGIGSTDGNIYITLSSSVNGCYIEQEQMTITGFILHLLYASRGGTAILPVVQVAKKGFLTVIILH